MDRLLYVSMSGAHRVMEAQANNAQNLANIGTTGYKAALDSAASQAIEGPGLRSRHNVVTDAARPDLTAGPLTATGRSLDIALQDGGWLAVEDAAGGGALTRRGDLQVDANGLLRTGAGHLVLGENGPIAIPPHTQLTLGTDGTISVVPLGQGPQAQVILERMLLVRPDPATLARGEDGLFRTADGELPPTDASVQLFSGHLEGSNVNMAQAMVEMIELSRQFEMQVRMMRTAGDNADTAAQLLRMN